MSGTTATKARATAHTDVTVKLENTRNRSNLDGCRTLHPETLALFKSLPGYNRDVSEHYEGHTPSAYYLQFENRARRDAAIAWINNWWSVDR